jgi:hypothetical protein
MVEPWNASEYTLHRVVLVVHFINIFDVYRNPFVITSE